MARVKIVRKDGTATPYFWSEEEDTDRSSVTVYKQTPDGVKRMTGVRYNSLTKRIKKD